MKQGAGMTGPKDQIIQATCALIEKQGYHATGLNQIVAESGAPKGSLYYYFPEGKDQITEAAIDLAGQMVEARVRESMQDIEDPAEAVRQLLYTIAHYVEQSGFAAGGPLQTVALETAASSERLNRACRLAYDRVQAVFHARLSAQGFAPQKATEMAVFIIGTIEGAVMLSRTYHTGDPLRQAGEMLAQIIRFHHQTH
jgi:TetR/AcrR family transcriptional regulator, lmrAB and yxaGH operons repressor